MFPLEEDPNCSNRLFCCCPLGLTAGVACPKMLPFGEPNEAAPPNVAPPPNVGAPPNEGAAPKAGAAPNPAGAEPKPD